jgi:serine/threonine protein kinase
MPLDATKTTLQSLGNYDILAKLAEGGMGAVYKGRSRATGELVAIKVLPPLTAKNPVLLKRFQQEFNAAHQLNHPNVVKAIEYCGTGPSPFLVMEFVEGESLGQKIERDGAMSEERAIAVLAQVCQGLHRAHKNHLIHRDVKPDNIMVTVDGIAKLTDLGLVKDADNELNLTKTGRGLGTPHFMAPEQFRNAKNVDIRCDIYSLGATLYMMLTGEVPFGKIGPLDCWMKKIRNDFIPPRELNPNISDRADWAIRRSMSGDADQRPSSCREFIEDLTGVTIRGQSVLTEQAPAVKAVDVWYLVYKDDMGETHTVKGTTEGIRRALKEDLLGDASNVRACRTKSGPFQPLKGHPEFRDLVVEPAPMPTATTNASSTSNPILGAKSTPVSSKLPTAASGLRPSLRPDPDAVDLNHPPSIARARPSLPMPEATTGENRPHIPMHHDENGTLKGMLLMILVAIVTSVLAALFLPKFM